MRTATGSTDFRPGSSRKCYNRRQRADWINSANRWILQTVVKKWFRDTDSGFLENNDGPEIRVSKADLVGCQFLKVGVTVEFECHIEKQGLVAKKVRLARSNDAAGKKGSGKNSKPFRFGVMT